MLVGNLGRNCASWRGATLSQVSTAPNYFIHMSAVCPSFCLSPLPLYSQGIIFLPLCNCLVFFETLQVSQPLKVSHGVTSIKVWSRSVARTGEPISTTYGVTCRSDLTSHKCWIGMSRALLPPYWVIPITVPPSNLTRFQPWPWKKPLCFCLQSMSRATAVSLTAQSWQL